LQKYSGPSEQFPLDNGYELSVHSLFFSLSEEHLVLYFFQYLVIFILFLPA